MKGVKDVDKIIKIAIVNRKTPINGEGKGSPAKLKGTPFRR